MSGDKSKAEELADKVGGKIQEKTGEAAGDHDLKHKGKKDQKDASNVHEKNKNDE